MFAVSAYFHTDILFGFVRIEEVRIKFGFAVRFVFNVNINSLFGIFRGLEIEAAHFADEITILLFGCLINVEFISRFFFGCRLDRAGHFVRSRFYYAVEGNGLGVAVYVFNGCRKHVCDIHFGYFVYVNGRHFAALNDFNAVGYVNRPSNGVGLSVVKNGVYHFIVAVDGNVDVLIQAFHPFGCAVKVGCNFLIAAASRKASKAHTCRKHAY